MNTHLFPLSSDSLFLRLRFLSPPNLLSLTLDSEMNLTFFYQVVRQDHKKLADSTMQRGDTSYSRNIGSTVTNLNIHEEYT